MKKGLFVFVLVVLSAVSPACAQQEGQFRGTGGIGYLFNGGIMGIGAGFEYVFKDAMSANLNLYSYSGASLFSLDYRYYFVTSSKQVYANAGISSVPGGSGLNLGVGAIFPIQDRLGINAAFKYELASPGPEAIGMTGLVGLVYTF